MSNIQTSKFTADILDQNWGKKSDTLSREDAQKWLESKLGYDKETVEHFLDSQFGHGKNPQSIAEDFIGHIEDTASLRASGNGIVKDGELSLEELNAVFAETGHVLDQEKFEAVLKSHDHKGSKNIDVTHSESDDPVDNEQPLYTGDAINIADDSWGIFNDLDKNDTDFLYNEELDDFFRETLGITDPVKAKELADAAIEKFGVGDTHGNITLMNEAGLTNMLTFIDDNYGSSKGDGVIEADALTAFIGATNPFDPSDITDPNPNMAEASDVNLEGKTRSEIRAINKLDTVNVHESVDDYAPADASSYTAEELAIYFFARAGGNFDSLGDDKGEIKENGSFTPKQAADLANALIASDIGPDITQEALKAFMQSLKEQDVDLADSNFDIWKLFNSDETVNTDSGSIFDVAIQSIDDTNNDKLISQSNPFNIERDAQAAFDDVDRGSGTLDTVELEMFFKDYFGADDTQAEALAMAVGEKFDISSSESGLDIEEFKSMLTFIEANYSASGFQGNGVLGTADVNGLLEATDPFDISTDNDKMISNENRFNIDGDSEAAFEDVDRGNNKLNTNELASFFSDYFGADNVAIAENTPPAESLAMDAIEAFDTDNDNKLSLSEFTEMLTFIEANYGTSNGKGNGKIASPAVSQLINAVDDNPFDITETLLEQWDSATTEAERSDLLASMSNIQRIELFETLGNTSDRVLFLQSLDQNRKAFLQNSGIRNDDNLELLRTEFGLARGSGSHDELELYVNDSSSWNLYDAYSKSGDNATGVSVEELTKFFEEVFGVSHVEASTYAENFLMSDETMNEHQFIAMLDTLQDLFSGTYDGGSYLNNFVKASDLSKLTSVGYSYDSATKKYSHS